MCKTCMDSGRCGKVVCPERCSAAFDYLVRKVERQRAQLEKFKREEKARQEILDQAGKGLEIKRKMAHEAYVSRLGHEEQ